jgi:hypothetical protein
MQTTQSEAAQCGQSSDELLNKIRMENGEHKTSAL